MENSASRRCVIYVRVSSKEQEREGFSIPAQKKLLSEYAAKSNLRVVRVFAESETAKSSGRKQFLEMVKFLRKDQSVSNLLVEKTDRLYRNIHDYVELDFEHLDITIHLVKENEILSKDSRSHQKFIHGIKLLMAKNYCDNLSEEVKKGHSEKVAQGGWPGVAPLGYKNRLEDHAIVIHKDEGLLVKKAFEMAATGTYSLARIKKALYQKGLRSKRSRKELSKSAMSRLLTNPFYYGWFSWKGMLYEGKHEALVSKDLWDQVQSSMGFRPKAKNTENNFAFSGVFTCGHCGCAITAEIKKKKSGKTYTYYHCTNGRGICSNVTYIREERIQQSIKEALDQIRLTPDIVNWTKNALLEASHIEEETRRAEIRTLTNRSQKLESFISKLYEDRLEGRIELDFWENRTAAFKNEQHDIQIRLQSLQKANTAFMVDGIRLMELANRAGELFNKMTADEKRECAAMVLSNPQIMDGSVCYKYKMPFQLFVGNGTLIEWRERRDSNPRPPP